MACTKAPITASTSLAITCLLRAVVATAVLTAGLTGCDREAPAAAVPTKAAAAPVTAANAKPLSFTIAGALPDLLKEGDEVQLFVTDMEPGPDDTDPKPAATAKVGTDGQFKITGQVASVLPAELHLGKGGMRALLIVEQGDFKVVRTAADVSIRGGVINDLVNGFDNDPAYLDAMTELHALENSSRNLKPGSAAATNAQREGMKLMQAVNDIQQAHDGKILTGDAPPLAKLFVLRSNMDMKRYDFAERMAMLKTLEQSLGPDPRLIAVRENLLASRRMEDAQNGIVIGQAYKEVVAKDKAGKTLKLSDTLAKNDLVLLDFWASWCAPCRDQFPDLVKLRKQYAGKLEIFAVSTDSDHAAWLKALKEENTKVPVPWINVIDGAAGSGDSANADRYGVMGLPDNYLITRDGVVLGKQLYGDALEAAIKKHLDAAGNKKG